METLPQGDLVPRGIRTRTLVMLGLLLLIVTYGLQRGNGFIYDDHLLIIDNVPLSTTQQVIEYFTGTHYEGQYYYRPVTKLVYGLEKRLFGDHAAPYHAVNVALIGLVFVLFTAILRRLYPAASGSLAVFLSLLCCLHPVSASVVYPISGMETLLVTVFGMASLLSYLHGGRWSFPAAICCMVLALLSKEQGIIVPALLVLSDVTGLRDGQPHKWQRHLPRWLCLAGTVLVYLLIRLSVFEGREFQAASSEVAGTPLQSFLYTLQVVFTPFLNLYYEPYYANWYSPARVTLSLAISGLILLAVYKRRSTIGGSAIFWCAYFLLAVLPTANLVGQETPFAERYVFAALPALAGLLAALASGVEFRGTTRTLALSAATLAFLLAVLVTVNRGPFYRDDLVFSQQWVSTNPAHPGARTLYGNALLRLDRREEATAHFEQSLKVTPDDIQQINSLGILYAADARVEEARALFQRALQIDPGYAAANFNLVHLERVYGDHHKARLALQEALSRHPGYAEEHYRLAVLFEEEGNLAMSRTHWKRALEIDPSHQGALQALQRTGG